MSDTQSSSLADHLKQLFEAAVAAPDVDSETGLGAWRKILSCDNDVRLMELVLFILKALEHLQEALKITATIKPDTKIRYQNALTILARSVVLPNVITLKWSDIKARFITKSNLDTLAYLDDSLTLRALATEVKRADIDSIIIDFQDLKERLEQSTIDTGVKKYLVRQVCEILYFLNRFEFFGVEGVWEGMSRFHLSFRRFAETFRDAGEQELYERGTTITEKTVRWLITLGGVYGGLTAVGAIATGLLGSSAH
jgi:hypothetical protein